MSRTSWLQYLYLAHLARPRGDRTLYRLAKRHRPIRILELGVSDLARSVRLLQVAQRFVPDTTIKYAALDAFDTRPGEMAALPMITAHRQLQTTTATVRLLPGDPATTLVDVANSHQRTDLLLIAPWLSAEELRSTWAFVPRMLTPTSMVLWEQPDEEGAHRFRTVSQDEITGLVKQFSQRRAA